MYILSFDVASKSLAVSLILFNDLYKLEIDTIIINMNNIQQLIKSINLTTSYDEIWKILSDLKCLLLKYNFIVDNFATPIFMDVVDLIPGKKLKDTTVITRSNRLKSYLYYIDKLIYTELKNNSYDVSIPIKVLLEYQMGPNDKSRNVCSQILFNYSKNDNIEFKSFNFQHITISEKSDLIYSTEIVGPSLKNKINLDKDKDHQFFLTKYANNYDANKKHSSHNFLTWVKKKSIENMIKDIPKKNIDDIADSVIMALAWFKFNIYT
jgi:hypothetical protein